MMMMMVELRVDDLRLVPDEEMITFRDWRVQISVTVIAIVMAVIREECVEK